MIRSALLVGATLMLVAGCGEQPQVVDYKKGALAGKRDTAPYANDQFKGDREAWARHLRARADYQNEYKRVN